VAAPQVAAAPASVRRGPRGRRAGAAHRGQSRQTAAHAVRGRAAGAAAPPWVAESGGRGEGAAAVGCSRNSADGDGHARPRRAPRRGRGQARLSGPMRRCPSNRHDAICVRRGRWARSSGVRRLFCGRGHRARARTVAPRGKRSERTSVQNSSINKLKKRSLATSPPVLGGLPMIHNI